jgi:hypothetical protein
MEGYAKGVDDNVGMANTSIDNMVSSVVNVGGHSSNSTGVTLGPGAVVVQFLGAVPSAAEAYAAGQAAGQGVGDALARRNVRNNVRAL